MALAITIVGGPGPITYRLQANTTKIFIGRDPLQAPLPGADPILLDLGQLRPTITIEGIVEETSGLDGAVIIPSKEQLEDAVEDWYNTTITVTINGDSYVSKIKDCSFTVTAAAEDRWEYVLNLFSKSRS